MAELICAACGKLFEVEKKVSRKYCDECKSLSHEIRTEMKKQREMEHEAEALEEEQRLLEQLREADPFNPALMSDKRLGAVIKLFRMTYGTYTAAYRSGILLQILKAKGFENPEKMINELEVE